MSKHVTIITVTFNRSHILPRSIESVLSQDYPHLRLLVVDDGSTDETARVLSSFEDDARVEVLRHDTNQGVLAARNTALEHLGSDVTYFGYNDSDDLLLPGAVRIAVDALEAHSTRYSMVYAWCKDVATGELQGSVWGRDGRTRRNGEVTLDDWLGHRLPGDWFQLVRRDLLGSMRYDPRAGGGEGALWARMLRVEPALLIGDVLQLKDRSGDDRVSHVRYDRAYAEGQMWISMYELQTLGDDMRRTYPKHYGALLRRLAHQAAMAGHRGRARMASRQALRIEPSLRNALVAGEALLAPAWVAREAYRQLGRIRSRRASRSGRS